MTPIEKAIEAAGSVAELARLVEESPQTIQNWRKRGTPPKKCAAVEKATGVPRYELCPDVFPAPETTTNAA